MQFMFTYIRKPVRLTWVWRIFALTERHVSTHPGEGERFPAGQSKLPERPAIQLIRGKEQSRHLPQSSLLGGPTGLPLPDHTWGTKNLVLGKMGKPVSLTALSLLASAKGHASLLSPRKQSERRCSASHPTAPSWTNTMLCGYFQPTFSVGFAHQKSTKAISLAP